MRQTIINLFTLFFLGMSVRASLVQIEETFGKTPNIIFVMMDRGKKYELMYTEYSCLFCTEQKIKDDAVKYGTRLTMGCIGFIKVGGLKRMNLE